MKHGTRRTAFSLRSLAVLFALAATVLAAAAVSADDHPTVLNGTDYARVYDYDYYVSKHPEFAGQSDWAPLKYFVNTGIAKGEQASPNFSVVSYRNANQDLRGEYGFDYAKFIKQYISEGYNQGRTTVGCDMKIQDPVTKYKGQEYNHVYDYEFYRSQYGYIRNHFKFDDFGALEYFVTKGIPKRQWAHADFNCEWYYNATPNMRWMCGQDWSRYYNYYQKNYSKYGPIKRCDSLKKVINWYSESKSSTSKKIDLSQVYDFEYYTKNNSRAYKYWKNKDDAAAVRDFVQYGFLHNLTGKKGVSPKSDIYIKTREKIYPDAGNNAYLKVDGYSSKTKYICLINQGEHMVYVFEGKKGSWKLKQKFACSVGAPSTPTPTGVYEVYGSKGANGNYYFDSGSSRCWYYTPWYGSYYFHSILYYQESGPNTVMDGRLGYNISHGCVRLALSSAKWIRDNVFNGTTVVSYNRPF